MNHIRCDCCGKRLEVPGAIVLGPPHRQDGYVRKLHLCVWCWPKIETAIEKHEKVNLGYTPVVPEPAF